MSEHIIVARRRLVCDICGGLIPAGEKCRMIRDDFQRGIVRFEHLKCPGSPAVAVEPVRPKLPAHSLHHHNNAVCFA